MSKERIQNKRFILIDDFLAKKCCFNTRKLLEEQGSELVAVGICVSKNFQEGYDRIQENGIPLYVQAGLEALDPKTNEIVFTKE